MNIRSNSFIFLLILAFLYPAQVYADIVKPALVEISVNTNGNFKIELRASLEALLTGINSQYKNTQDAPTAKEYDDLRVLQAEQLRVAFEPFKKQILQEIELLIDGQRAEFEITAIEIPEPGYVKVPRISLIVLEGDVPKSAKALTWYYPERFGDNAVRVRQVDEQNEQWHWSSWQWLKNDKTSEQFSLTEVFTQPTISEIISVYLVSGFEHIVPKGLDHILFILGIFLLSSHLKPLLWQVTMFTIAHTITLGLTMNGVISLPANIVEPLIALSIAFVAIENIVTPELHRYRLLIVFFFGLLHGMGFASVLSDFGMPKNDFATALISFNIGVEIAQVMLILIAWLILDFGVRKQLSSDQQYRYIVVIPGSLVIAMIGLFWTYERIVI
jgi:hydrogenase/urease accessory protein HupE